LQTRTLIGYSNDLRTTLDHIITTRQSCAPFLTEVQLGNGEHESDISPLFTEDMIGYVVEDMDPPVFLKVKITVEMSEVKGVYNPDSGLLGGWDIIEME